MKKKPRLSLFMIVKDEEEDLPRCLKTVQGVVDEIVVVDTGSVDRTVEIARAHGARVHKFPWTGSFAEARNFAVKKVRGEWILWMDADEELCEADSGLLPGLLDDPAVEGYHVRIFNYVGESPGTDIEVTFSPRLFRNNTVHRFSGDIHEQWTGSLEEGSRFRLCPVRIFHYGYLNPKVRQRGKNRRNIEILERLVAQNPGDLFHRFNLGAEYYRLGQYEKAVAQFEKSRRGLMTGAPGSGVPAQDILAAPGWVAKMLKLHTVALLHLNLAPEALDLIESGLRIYPDYTDLVYLRGIACAEQKRHAAAVGAFRQCLAMGPAPVPPYVADPGVAGFKAHYALARVYEEMGKLDQAVSCYRAAFESNTAYLDPLYRLGAILGRGDDLEAVRDSLNRYFDLANPSHLIVLADIFFKIERYSVPLEYLNQALAAGAAAGDLAMTRGLCFARTGKFEQALFELQLIPRGDPNREQGWLNEAFCLWNLDRIEEAREVLGRLGTGREPYLALAGLFRAEAARVLQEGIRRFPEAEILKRSLDELTRNPAESERTPGPSEKISGGPERGETPA